MPIPSYAELFGGNPGPPQPASVYNPNGDVANGTPGGFTAASQANAIAPAEMSKPSKKQQNPSGSTNAFTDVLNHVGAFNAALSATSKVGSTGAIPQTTGAVPGMAGGSGWASLDGTKTPYTGDPNAPNALALLNNRTPGDGGDMTNTPPGGAPVVKPPVTAPGGMPGVTPGAGNGAPIGPNGKPIPTRTMPPGYGAPTAPAVDPATGKPRIGPKPPADGTAWGGAYDQLAAQLPWLAQRPDLRQAYMQFAERVGGSDLVDPADWLVTEHPEIAQAHGELSGLYKRSGRDTYFTDANGKTRSYLAWDGQGSGPVDPEQKFAQYQSYFPKLTRDMLLEYQSLEGIDGTNGVTLSDWIRGAHPEIIGANDPGVQLFGKGGYSTYEHQLVDGKLVPRDWNAIKTAAAARNTSNDPNSLESMQKALAGTAPGSPAYADLQRRIATAQTATAPAATPPVTPPPAAPPVPAELSTPAVPSGAVPPGTTPPTSGTPTTTGTPAATTTSTAPATPSDEIQKMIDLFNQSKGPAAPDAESLMNPMFARQRQNTLNDLRAKASTTPGRIGSGGYGENEATALSNLSAQQSSTLAGVKSQEYLAKLQQNTTLTQLATQAGMQKYLSDVNTDLEKYKVTTNGDLQKWLADQNNALAKYGIDTNVVLQKYLAAVGLQGKQIDAKATVDAAALHAAATQAAAAASAAAQQQQTAMQYQLGIAGLGVDREKNIAQFILGMLGLGQTNLGNINNIINGIPPGTVVVKP